MTALGSIRKRLPDGTYDPIGFYIVTAATMTVLNAYPDHEPGQLAYVEADQKYYSWDGTKWVALGSGGGITEPPYVTVSHAPGEEPAAPGHAFTVVQSLRNLFDATPVTEPALLLRPPTALAPGELLYRPANAQMDHTTGPIVSASIDSVAQMIIFDPGTGTLKLSKQSLRYLDQFTNGQFVRFVNADDVNDWVEVKITSAPGAKAPIYGTNAWVDGVSYSATLTGRGPNAGTAGWNGLLKNLAVPAGVLPVITVAAGQTPTVPAGTAALTIVLPTASGNGEIAFVDTAGTKTSILTIGGTIGSTWIAQGITPNNFAPFLVGNRGDVDFPGLYYFAWDAGGHLVFSGGGGVGPGVSIPTTGNAGVTAFETYINAHPNAVYPTGGNHPFPYYQAHTVVQTAHIQSFPIDWATWDAAAQRAGGATGAVAHLVGDSDPAVDKKFAIRYDAIHGQFDVIVGANGAVVQTLQPNIQHTDGLLGGPPAISAMDPKRDDVFVNIADRLSWIYDGSFWVPLGFGWHTVMQDTLSTTKWAGFTADWTKYAAYRVIVGAPKGMKVRASKAIHMSGVQMLGNAQQTTAHKLFIEANTERILLPDTGTYPWARAEFMFADGGAYGAYDLRLVTNANEPIVALGTGYNIPDATVLEFVTNADGGKVIVLGLRK
jgi:hypothetical protein